MVFCLSLFLSLFYILLIIIIKLVSFANRTHTDRIENVYLIVGLESFCCCCFTFLSLVDIIIIMLLCNLLFSISSRFVFYFSIRFGQWLNFLFDFRYWHFNHISENTCGYINIDKQWSWRANKFHFGSTETNQSEVHWPITEKNEQC